MSEIATNIREFVRIDPPSIKERETTIFDIAGFPHYENVFSRCYAYFLNPEVGHQLSGVFLDSLLQIIKVKTGKELLFDSWEVTTEVSTKSGKRIDVLVSQPNTLHGPHIIIENKINHWLHNDLQHYWDHCESPEEFKVGVVLSLKSEIIHGKMKGKFVNILHTEWLDSIRANLDMAYLNQKHKIYILDFLTALDNLKTDNIMNESVRFFFENADKVNRLIETQNAAHQYIIRQLRTVANKLGFTFSGSAYDYRYIEVPEMVSSGIFYTIIFDNLLNEKRTIRVVLEIQERSRHFVPEFDIATKQLTESKSLLKKTREHKGAWLHYIAKDYAFNLDEMNNLGEYLANYIRTDFQPIMDQICQVIRNK